jgi:hypothetical protein
MMMKFFISLVISSRIVCRCSEDFIKSFLAQAAMNDKLRFDWQEIQTIASIISFCAHISDRDGIYRSKLLLNHKPQAPIVQAQHKKKHRKKIVMREEN